MATAFLSTWSSRPDLLKAFEARHAAAAAAHPERASAALDVSRVVRGGVVRRWVSRERAGASFIERFYRGYRGRCFIARAKHARRLFEAPALHHYAAGAIQRTMRGFYSRRYKYDFAARKAYIARVVVAGDALRDKLSRQLRAQVASEAAAEVAAERAAFAKLTTDLHHLVSTHAAPGVFNSPYLDELPEVDGVAVEQHLRAAAKERVRRQGTRSSRFRPMAPTLSGSRCIPLRPPPTKRSVQASSPFDAPHDAAQVEAKIDRLKWTADGDFRAGHEVHSPRYERGIAKDDPFLDPWKNQWLQRGVPESQKAMLTQRRTALGKHPTAHFHTAVGGNKSTAHANGLFSVIQAAEISGGATGKHLHSAVSSMESAYAQSQFSDDEDEDGGGGEQHQGVPRAEERHVWREQGDEGDGDDDRLDHDEEERAAWANMSQSIGRGGAPTGAEVRGL